MVGIFALIHVDGKILLGFTKSGTILLTLARKFRRCSAIDSSTHIIRDKNVEYDAETNMTLETSRGIDIQIAQTW